MCVSDNKKLLRVHGMRSIDLKKCYISDVGTGYYTKPTYQFFTNMEILKSIKHHAKD